MKETRKSSRVSKFIKVQTTRLLVPCLLVNLENGCSVVGGQKPTSHKKKEYGDLNTNINHIKTKKTTRDLCLLPQTVGVRRLERPTPTSRT
jgi:hypothetical protein